MKALATFKDVAKRIGGVFQSLLDWVHGTRLWLKIESWRYDPPEITGRQLFWAVVLSAAASYGFTKYMRWDAVRDAGCVSIKIQGRLPKAEFVPPIPLLSPSIAPAAIPPLPMLPPPPSEALVPEVPAPPVKVINATPGPRKAARAPKARKPAPRLRAPEESAIRPWST
jgi:hypothetical protein